MKTILISTVLAIGMPLLAQSEDHSLVGEWQLTTTMLGISSANRLQLAVAGKQITGSLYSEGEKIPISGAVEDTGVHFGFKIGNQEVAYIGTVDVGIISGAYTFAGKNGKLSGNWTARRPRQDKPASPRTLEFSPTEFHRALAADIPPALRIWPGDTVRTKSVDAGGQDEKSVYRVAGGNPLTGPFYVEGAMPGDVLAITIKHLRLNRDWAISGSGLVGRALTTGYTSHNKQDGRPTRWHLDTERLTATLEDPSDNLKAFSVILRPMLGCVGVAPGPGDAPLSTRDSGDVGGNMDFSGITEGTTVFLRVQQPGALLYLGDAHALEGDGELNGDALETSMDIAFSTDVLREKYIGTPRAESRDFLMAIGLSSSLDEAFREATSELLSWLQSEYRLSTSEAAIVIGTSVEYTISEVADRNVGVVAKIKKDILRSLPSAK